MILNIIAQNKLRRQLHSLTSLRIPDSVIIKTVRGNFNVAEELS